MQINLVYSGGTQNSTQEESLGGFPSPVSVTSGEKNNLFDDITPQQTTIGVTDYRCLYVFNDAVDLRFIVTLYIEYLNEIGSTVQLGFLRQNCQQSIRFTQVPTGGTFTLTVQGLKTPEITWDNDPDVLLTNIEEAMQTVTDCTVNFVLPNQYYYIITFDGLLKNKSLTDMSVTDNSLLPYGTIFPTIKQEVAGSPINTIAPDTGIETLSPTGIPFFTTLTPGAEIGTLFPAEGFPVWIKRSLAAGFDAVEGDGFKLHMKSKLSL
jgi:hypothetical protein